MINEVMVIADGGNLGEAISMLEERLSKVTFPDLVEKAKAFLDQMKKHHARNSGNRN